MSESCSAKGSPVPKLHLLSRLYIDQNSNMAESRSSEFMFSYVSFLCSPSSIHSLAVKPITLHDVPSLSQWK